MSTGLTRGSNASMPCRHLRRETCRGHRPPHRCPDPSRPSGWRVPTVSLSADPQLGQRTDCTSISIRQRVAGGLEAIRPSLGTAHPWHELLDISGHDSSRLVTRKGIYSRTFGPASNLPREPNHRPVERRAFCSDASANPNRVLGNGALCHLGSVHIQDGPLRLHALPRQSGCEVRIDAWGHDQPPYPVAVVLATTSTIRRRTPRGRNGSVRARSDVRCAP